MLKAKTTALIAAMSLLGTVAPAAFAQDDNSFNAASIKDVTQYNTNNFDISQTLEQNGIAEAETGYYSYGDPTAVVDQEASQRFCIQVNNNNQVSGDDSNSEQENEISAEAEAKAKKRSAAEAEATVDCS